MTKVCNDCNTEKDIEKFHIKKYRTYRSGICGTCKFRRKQAKDKFLKNNSPEQWRKLRDAENEANRKCRSKRVCNKLEKLRSSTDKECKRCGQTKAISEFGKFTSSQGIRIRHNCNKCISDAKRAKDHTMAGRYKRYKFDAANKRSRKLDFDLSKEQFESIVTKPCYICRRTEQGCGFDMGIDRYDNNMGYVYSNCRPCCRTCNEMKLNRTFDDFIDHIRKIGRVWQ